jgi:hypothetical protein
MPAMSTMAGMGSNTSGCLILKSTIGRALEQAATQSLRIACYATEFKNPFMPWQPTLWLMNNHLTDNTMPRPCHCCACCPLSL